MTTRTKKRVIFIIIGCVLLLAVIGLSIALGLMVSKNNANSMELNGIYEKSYLETMDNMSDVRMKLTKVNVLSGSTLRKSLLNDIGRQCNVIATNLAQLGQNNEEMAEVMKFFNQMGDYCYYLAGRDIGTEDTAHLKTFQSILTDIFQSFGAVREQMIRGDKVDVSVLRDLSAVTSSLKNIKHSSVDYPELIYDGPFSDGLNDRESVYLKGLSEIDKDKGAELVTQYFEGAKEVKYIGESKTSLASFIYTFQLGRNEATAYITKKGGKLYLLNAYCNVENPVLTEDECVEKAKGYLKKFGYEDMELVWVSNNNSTVYINFAYVQNNIVVYPDLIMVKVCSETGDLLGMEAQNYLYNHKTRDVSLAGTVDYQLNSALTLKKESYCLIPTEWNQEILCKEIVAEMENHTYYIYVNVKTGEEEKVMVVIDEDGQLLM